MKVKLKPGTRKTHEQFIAEVDYAVGDEYSILSQYLGQNEYVKIKHNVCGHIYDVKPKGFLRKDKPQRCQKCANSRNNDGNRKTTPLLSGLRIWSCSELWYRSQMRLRSGVTVALV